MIYVYNYEDAHMFIYIHKYIFIYVCLHVYKYMCRNIIHRHIDIKDSNLFGQAAPKLHFSWAIYAQWSFELSYCPLWAALRLMKLCTSRGKLFRIKSPWGTIFTFIPPCLIFQLNHIFIITIRLILLHMYITIYVRMHT